MSDYTDINESEQRARLADQTKEDLIEEIMERRGEGDLREIELTAANEALTASEKECEALNKALIEADRMIDYLTLRSLGHSQFGILSRTTFKGFDPAVAITNHAARKKTRTEKPERPKLRLASDPETK